jgi:hypothetical protein
MQSRCSSIRAASAGTRQKDLGLCWSRQIALPPSVPIPKLASTSGTSDASFGSKGALKRIPLILKHSPHA